MHPMWRIGEVFMDCITFGDIAAVASSLCLVSLGIGVLAGYCIRRAREGKGIMKQIFFKGEPVKHPDYGDGVVDDIYNESTHPIAVRFTGHKYLVMFTTDGVKRCDAYRSLTFRDGTQFSYGTPPERKWIPTEAHWAMVRDNLVHPAIRRYVIKYIPTKRFPYFTGEGSSYRHAEPCDAPEWEGVEIYGIRVLSSGT